MANFARQRFPFVTRGMNLSRPVDQLPPEKWRLLKNVRPYGEAQIMARQGLIKDTQLDAVGHSLKRFDDPIVPPSEFPNAFGGPRTDPAHIRLIGASTNLYIGVSSGAVDPVGASAVQDSTPTPLTSMSGNPLSFAVYRPDLNNRPWCIVADSVETWKVSSNAVAFTIGVAPPQFDPTLALGAANADGPDIGTTGRPYSYRLVARADPILGTGAISNPGPPVLPSYEVSPTGQNVDITLLDTHPDPQVKYLDVYRFGGSLPEWIYIGTIENSLAGTMTDIFSDADIASNQRIEFDNNQPWLTVDSPRRGTCTVVPQPSGAGDGAIVTWTGGDVFKPADTHTPYWVAGNTITIAGTAFTLRRPPMDATTLEVVEDVQGIAGGDWIIAAPEMAHVSLPFVWGPFGTGEFGTFYFGCGDPNRPGAFYWTKGNNPESHPGTNVLDVTSPSEPTMNGCIYEGKALLFSTERIFNIYPSFGNVSDFSAVEVPNTPGLSAHWALAVGMKVWYRSKDGIYEFAGGAARNITDEDLYPLFPHEGGTVTAFQTPDGLLDSDGDYIGPPAPNELEPQFQRLCYGDGFLYFDYTDADGAPNTLVLDTVRGGWYWDLYTTAVRMHYYEEGINFYGGGTHALLVCSDRASVSHMGGFDDESETITGQIRSGSRDMGDARPRKQFGDVQMDLDSVCQQLNVELGWDNFSFFSVIGVTGTNLSGRRRVIGDINAGLGQYAFNVGIDIVWTTDADRPIFYAWEPSFLAKPEVTSRRVTDWDNANDEGAKFFQGFRLRADTYGINRSVEIQSDGGVVQQTFTMNHSGEETRPYVFTTPFISHLVRFHPIDIQFWRDFGVEWIWEPAPELVPIWKTQEMTFGYDGFFFHRDSYLGLISSDVVTLTVNVDGAPFAYTFPSTASAYLKQYKILQPMKGKAASYFITSPAPFRLFQKDSEIRAKQWGVEGPFQVQRPFGDWSAISGARI